MPQIGEIKKGHELGYKRNNRYIWQACATCSKERWVSWIKGQPAYTICRQCTIKAQLVENSPSWKGGRIKDSKGYILILLHRDDFFYSMAEDDGYIFEHRLIMAKTLGRCLQPWELVHHKGTKYPKGSRENRADNRSENLQLVTDDRHKQLTILENRIKKLEGKVEEQAKQIKLLRWQLKQKEESNART